MHDNIPVRYYYVLDEIMPNLLNEKYERIKQIIEHNTAHELTAFLRSQPFTESEDEINELSQLLVSTELTPKESQSRIALLAYLRIHHINLLRSALRFNSHMLLKKVLSPDHCSLWIFDVWDNERDAGIIQSTVINIYSESPELIEEFLRFNGVLLLGENLRSQSHRMHATVPTLLAWYRNHPNLFSQVLHAKIDEEMTLLSKFLYQMPWCHTHDHLLLNKSHADVVLAFMSENNFEFLTKDNDRWACRIELKMRRIKYALELAEVAGEPSISKFIAFAKDYADKLPHTELLDEEDKQKLRTEILEIISTRFPDYSLEQLKEELDKKAPEASAKCPLKLADQLMVDSSAKVAEKQPTPHSEGTKSFGFFSRIRDLISVVKDSPHSYGV
jgi:hypothetical protein